MDELSGAIKLAKENGLIGAALFGVAALLTAIKRRWIVIPAMADMQAELARLNAVSEHKDREIEHEKQENSRLKLELEALKKSITEGH